MRDSGGELGEVLVPDPANLVGGVVLVFSEPKLAFLGHNIEDLKRNRLVSKIEASQTVQIAYLSGDVG